MKDGSSHGLQLLLETFILEINTYQNKIKKPFKKSFFSNFDFENQIPSFFTITFVTSESKYMDIKSFQIFGGK